MDQLQMSTYLWTTTQDVTEDLPTSNILRNIKWYTLDEISVLCIL